MAACHGPAPRSDVPADETKTSDFYRTANLPNRFDRPCMFISVFMILKLIFVLMNLCKCRRENSFCTFPSERRTNIVIMKDAC